MTKTVCRDGEITQAAVAWLLGCVFVRLLEDNLLIAEAWIADRSRAVEQTCCAKPRTREATTASTPEHVFTEVTKHPAVAPLL